MRARTARGAPLPNLVKRRTARAVIDDLPMQFA
jgi:hypothetical protein